MGKENRELPTASVGEFRSPHSHLTAIESFSTNEGLAHIPVLNISKVRVTSRALKHPTQSVRSVVSFFSCFNKVHGLPGYIENVHRTDNTLACIKSTLANGKNQLPEGSQLMAFVSDFRVDLNLMETENFAVID